ncbi:MAG: tripartite tricarboxylate transporter substrate binding protein [Rhizobium sp.]|nr:tripartite tricarboxylate transporter substrate binding protein [Rhizobium sp.]
MRRRDFIRLSAAFAASVAFPWATQAYAALDSLRVIAPAGPGGGWDQTARAIEEVVRALNLAGSVSVENVPGAGGTIGLSQLAGKEAGNPNVLMVMGLVMVGAILTNQSPATLDQSTPIARLTGEFEVVVVPGSSELKSMADLVEKLKTDTAAVSFGGGSAGGTDHILAGLITKAAGADVTKLNYIPYSGGGEALAAILGGHVTAGISSLSEWEGQIQSGELRVLAISSGDRLQGLDAPTLKEQGLDIELANWRGVIAPPGLDDAGKAALLDIVRQVHDSAEWKKILADKKWTDLYLAGDEFAALVSEENARTTEVLKGIGLVE